jgi:Arc/MetJ-type ribon-helix-helix transcriptional regulator
MKAKRRLSASVDADLLGAAEVATKRGDAANVSAWVNEAMRLKLEHDKGLAELAAVIADFEAEHGEITSGEIEQAARAARARAVTVRGTRAAETRAEWPTVRARGRRS